MWNVIVADRITDPDVEQAVFGDQAKVTALSATDTAGIEERISHADAILAWHDLQWNAELLARLDRCRVLVRVGVGVDNVDVQAATTRNIVVCNVPDYGTNDVADHAIAMILALARGLIGNDRFARSGAWTWGLAPTFRITGKVLGIVGLGRIGTATALRAKVFGMQVGFYDPYKPRGWEKSLALRRFDDLQSLAHESDIISIHAPLTRETHGMVDASFFAAARHGAVLVNTARGQIVDWRAFSSALEAGLIASAAFDVLPIEPPDHRDPVIDAWLTGASWIRDRLIVTPHCAFYSSEAVLEMRQKAAEEALRVLSGQSAWNQILPT